MNQVFALFAVSYFAVHLPIMGMGLGMFAWRRHWLLPTWYWELMICVVPYLIWSLLFWLDDQGKGWGNFWEAAMLGGAGLLLYIVRAGVPSGDNKAWAAGSLGLLALTAVALWRWVPGFGFN